MLSPTGQKVEVRVVVHPNTHLARKNTLVVSSIGIDFGLVRPERRAGSLEA